VEKGFYLQLRNDLWLMQADGSGQTRLTTGTENWSLGPWSPDSKLLLLGYSQSPDTIYGGGGSGYFSFTTVVTKSFAVCHTGQRKLYKTKEASTSALWLQ